MMKKRFFSLLLITLLLLGLGVTAFAESFDSVYIRDELEFLTESEYAALDILASNTSNELDLDVVWVLTNEVDLDTYAHSLIMGSRPDQIMFLDNHLERSVFLFGKARQLTDGDVQKLLDAYMSGSSYLYAVSNYLEAAGALITEKLSDSPLTAITDESMEKLPRLVDGADLIRTSQEQKLLAKLDEISQRQQLDVVVVTVNSLGNKTAMEYADDFFDYKGYGFGENHDGILILVSMEERDWWISTCGYGITAFTDAGLDYIADRVVPLLSEGEYSKAFDTFAEKCDEFITQAKTGEPYDVRNLPKDPFKFGKCLLVSLLIGAFTAGCVVWGLKGQLKTVRADNKATNYAQSLVPSLTVNKDTYLYSTMSSRPKPKPSESSGRSGSSFGSSFSGGSTIHRSSSGRFHGGRGGKF